MPRKTLPSIGTVRYIIRGFNEAAARCRGKPAGPDRWQERNGGFNEAAARCRGKPAT